MTNNVMFDVGFIHLGMQVSTFFTSYQAGNIDTSISISKSNLKKIAELVKHTKKAEPIFPKLVLPS